VNPSHHYDVGVDIGGTFTDFVMRDRRSGALHLYKSLTTPDDPSRSVVEGVRHLLETAEGRADAIGLVVHGTTLITNALIERRGAHTALVATDGHQDVLEIGTEIRYDSYDLAIDRPAPLVPRTLRFGVDERLDNTGNIVRPLNLLALDRVAELIRDSEVEAVAVCFLHSFRNPQHERDAQRRLAAALPGVSVSISSDVAPEIREYQRMSTTVANAYVRPLTERYLHKIEDELQELGYEHDLYLMLSSGGVSTASTASDYPIQLLESGPAGGVLCAAFLGTMTGRREVVSFDMGGTTAKMAFVSDGSPLIARSFEVARVSRFRMGSGLPVQVPVVEMIEIGAGGGSIAHTDDLGLLKVGPRSAGAAPGPACYGFGGTEPTVTDANVVLGYLAPENFLGGAMTLDSEAAHDAIRTGVAEPLGIDVVAAARGIFDIVNENMVAATKVHVAERGKDPRRAALVAFGGAGPVHAHAIARALGMQEVICPLRAGVASALGFLTAPIAFDFARSLVAEYSRLDHATLSETFESMAARGAAMLMDAGIAEDQITHVRSADMRYLGQAHEVGVRLPPGTIDSQYVAGIADRFHETYRALYGRSHPEAAIELVTCRVVSSGPPRDLRLPDFQRGSAAPPGSALQGHRRVHFGAAGFVDTRVIDRYALLAGNVIEGPAVVEERESTAVIPPGMEGKVDDFGNLVLNEAQREQDA
jgi:N-methylhydantoinase A